MQWEDRAGLGVWGTALEIKDLQAAWEDREDREELLALRVRAYCRTSGG